MEEQTVNVLLTSFPGLGLPRTLVIPTKSSTSIADLTAVIRSRIPLVQTRLILTTPRNTELLPSSKEPIAALLSSSDHDAMLPLRLSAPLCGGKGGFGSQLRAAGGRMSSKRKKQVGDPNASSRNLDGRRLRTVTEAKALAEYLATKPEMDRKQKEERRKRWEQVVEAAERREQEIKSGGKGRLDGQWTEDKREAGERTREAVAAVMASGDYKDLIFTKDGEHTSEEDDMDEGNVSNNEKSGSDPTSPDESGPECVDKGKSKEALKTYFGWDEDDDFMSSDDDEGGEDEGDEEVIAAAILSTPLDVPSA